MKQRRFSLSCQLSAGFALPTVLIASIIMMIVLLSAASAVASIRTSLDNQYYTQLAYEAAESGSVYAAQCFKSSGYTTPWVDAGRSLRPDTDCSGNTISGGSAYVLNTSTVHSTFTVTSTTSDAGTTRFQVTGTAQRLRTSDGVAWRTYTYDQASEIKKQLMTATSIASGIVEVCGVINQQTWCWGRNDYGQLGNGTTTDSDTPVKVARLPGGLQGKKDKFVAAGESFTCTVTTDNAVYCWGRNDDAGELGNGTATNTDVPTPVDTSTGLAGKTITGLVALHKSACVIASGDVYCWGFGDAGDLGNGSTFIQRKPVRVNTIGASNGLPVTYLSGTPYSHFACAVASGKVYCWGKNDRGQLGDGTTTNRSSPVAVQTSGSIGSRQAVQVASSGTYAWTSGGLTSGSACANMTDGTLWCWGDNQFGQMGQGTASTSLQLSPIQIGGPLAGKNITQVTMGFTTPCALTDANALYCWGQNYHGQVGDGTTTDRYTPTPVVMQTPGMAGKQISLIVGGGYRNCAIAGGRTYCWGNNGGGQIGDGTHINRSVPTEATFLSQYIPMVYY